MKEQPTDGELAMSAILRELWGPEGIAWYSQESIDLPNGKGCVVDFAHYRTFMEVDLIIEVDGGIHNKKRRGHDARRTRALNKLGIVVLRYKNDDVIANPTAVRFSIQSALKEISNG